MIEVPVSTDDSMLPGTCMGASRGRSIRIAMFCVLMLLVALATPWDVGASPSSAHPPTSSPLYAAQQADNDDDGIPDASDMDDDNDRVADDMDDDPFNAPSALETPDIIAPDQDTDNDGIENIMDPDDDNDVIEDDEDPAPFTPVPPSNTPAPPTETPDTPGVEAPAPAQPDVVQPERPVVQRDSPQPPPRPATDGLGTGAVQSRTQDTAPLVVALPSTGNTGDIQPDSSWPTLLAALAAILGGTGLVIQRRPKRPAAQA